MESVSVGPRVATAALPDLAIVVVIIAPSGNCLSWQGRCRPLVVEGSRRDPGVGVVAF